MFNCLTMDTFDNDDSSNNIIITISNETILDNSLSKNGCINNNSNSNSNSNSNNSNSNLSNCNNYLNNNNNQNLNFLSTIQLSEPSDSTVSDSDCEYDLSNFSKHGYKICYKKLTYNDVN